MAEAATAVATEVAALVAGGSTVGVFAAADLAAVVSVAEEFVNLADSTEGGLATEVALGAGWVSMDIMETIHMVTVMVMVMVMVMAVVLMDTSTIAAITKVDSDPNDRFETNRDDFDRRD